jgi:hypothetical protein
MSDQFQFFEVFLKRRGRGWQWSLSTAEGVLVMRGIRSSRSAARYEANRALFLLLLTSPYRPRSSDREIQASREVRPQRPHPSEMESYRVVRKRPAA